MKKKNVSKVYAGKNIIFSLGDESIPEHLQNFHGKTHAMSTELQEIPEKDERPSSSKQIIEMPQLDLNQINQSTSTLNGRQSQNLKRSIENAYESNSQGRIKGRRNRSKTNSRKSKSNSIDRS